MDEKERSLTVEEKSTTNTSKIHNKIDVHAHFHPPELFEEIEKRLGKSGLMLGWRVLSMKRDTFMQTYSIEERLDWMSKFGIDKSVFSFPNINLFMNEIAEPKKRNEMSQFINDFFAKTHEKYPTRALFLADVPFGTDYPYIEGCERMAIDYLNRTKITKRQLEKIYSKNATALFELKT